MGGSKGLQTRPNPPCVRGEQEPEISFSSDSLGAEGVSTDAGARYELTSIQFRRIPHSAMTPCTFVKVQSFI